MGGVPVKHHSKSKVGRRRSQLALKAKTIVKCKNCGNPTLPHHACSFCNFYPTKTKKESNKATA